MIRIIYDPDTATATIEGRGVRTQLVDAALSFTISGERGPAAMDAVEAWTRWELAEPRRRDIVLTGLVPEIQ